MDSCASPDRGRILKILAELTDRTGFESALHTVDVAIRHEATDPDSLKTLYNRIYADVPLLPPLDNTGSIPSAQIIPFSTNDLSTLDAALRRGGVANG